MIVWKPSASDAVAKVPFPPDSVALPIDVPPSKNVTVPVGVPEPGAAAVTVAVTVITRAGLLSDCT